MGVSPDGDVFKLGVRALRPGLLRVAVRVSPGRPRLDGSGCERGSPPMCQPAGIHSVISVNFLRNGRESDVDRRPVTVRVARWSATHPWRAIAMWIAFVAVCFVVGGAVGLNEANDDSGIGEAGRAEALYDQANFDDPAVENVLITSKSGPLDQAAATKAANDAIGKMTGRTDVTKVEGPI